MGLARVDFSQARSTPRWSSTHLNPIKARRAMRFIVMVKANKDSEAGVLPTQEMLAEMGKFNDELVQAGGMLAGGGGAGLFQGGGGPHSGGQGAGGGGAVPEAKGVGAGVW